MSGRKCVRVPSNEWEIESSEEDESEEESEVYSEEESTEEESTEEESTEEESTEEEENLEEEVSEYEYDTEDEIEEAVCLGRKLYEKMSLVETSLQQVQRRPLVGEYVHGLEAREASAPSPKGKKPADSWGAGSKGKGKGKRLRKRAMRKRAMRFVSSGEKREKVSLRKRDPPFLKPSISPYEIRVRCYGKAKDASSIVPPIVHEKREAVVERLYPKKEKKT